jgi:TonB-dependent starch-binding outer membrane protein SusC
MKKFYTNLLRLYFMISMMAFSIMSQAQSITVSGTIVDETGQPTPGVNILEKGTASGTSSDADGKYSMNVTNGNATLVFSFIGYKTQEVAVGNRSVVDVALAPDITSLEEVVVTGYSEQRKRDITGAVSIVKAEELKTVAAANFGTQLAGRASGVTTSTSGSPGDGVNIRIRGFSSLSRGGSDPLIIIDGVQVQGDKGLVGLNPNDVASVQVLKDASAASIYCSSANSGGILLTT